MGRIALAILLCSAFLSAKDWKLHVKGMHCIACTLAVKKALLSVGGVKEAKVNFKTQAALVEADESVTIQTMQKAVEATGYKIDTPQ